MDLAFFVDSVLLWKCGALLHFKLFLGSHAACFLLRLALSLDSFAISFVLKENVYILCCSGRVLVLLHSATVLHFTLFFDSVSLAGFFFLGQLYIQCRYLLSNITFTAVLEQSYLYRCFWTALRLDLFLDTITCFLGACTLAPRVAGMQVVLHLQ